MTRFVHESDTVQQALGLVSVQHLERVISPIVALLALRVRLDTLPKRSIAESLSVYSRCFEAISSISCALITLINVDSAGSLLESDVLNVEEMMLMLADFGG